MEATTMKMLTKHRSRQERGLTQADYEQAEERDADGDGDEEWEEGGDEDDVALHAMDTSPAPAGKGCSAIRIIRKRR